MSFQRHKKYRHKRDDRHNKHKRNDGIAMGVKVHYTGDSEEQRTADLEKALSKFKKIINKEGLMIEIRDRQYYKSKGRKRYEKKRKWLYRLKLNKEKSERINQKKERNKRGHKNDRRSKD